MNYVGFFVFFMQKTAYEMRISDWSSDVCSSDLLGFGPAFALDDGVRDTLWRRVRDSTPHRDVHFHDTRAEAIWRLSKKLDVLQLARAIGHRDLASLMIYYNEPASELAKRLG